MQPIIAPFQSGLFTTVEPWLAPEDSFGEAINVHLHHGFIEKRSGYSIFGTLNFAQNISAITQANPAVVTVGSTTNINNGNTIYIFGVVGMTEVNGMSFVVANKTATTFELMGIDSTLFGAYVSGGIVMTAMVNPDRVMGISRYITDTGAQTGLAFNTTRAYRYDPLSMQYLILDTGNIMSGSDIDYVWAVNWNSSNIKNRLYFTNGKSYSGGLDGIRYYDGDTSLNTTVSYRPNLDITGVDGMGARVVLGAKLIFVLRGRLVLLNTIETDGQKFQRARWSQFQAPSEWRDAIGAEGGGFVDAPTGDQIISARALQNEIIVFFTNSVWALSPTSSPQLPFRWRKINNFRACFGKMASIGYDQYAKSIGNRGITATDGSDTRRVDEKIHDFVTDEINLEEADKIFCERSYENERWWTLYAKGDNAENNGALIYDDESQGYTKYDITLNCLGFGNESEDWAFEDFTAANDRDWTFVDGPTDEDFSSFHFVDNQEMLLGGSTLGEVFDLETGATDNGTEIVAEILTNQWNPFKNENKEARLKYVDIYFDTDLETELTVSFYLNDDFSPYVSTILNLLPNLGFIADVNDITQANPAVANIPDHGLTTGDVIYIYNVSGMTQINNTPLTVTVIDKNFVSLGVDSTAYGAFTGSGGVYKKKYYSEKTFNRVFAGGIGYAHRMKIETRRNLGTLRIHAFKPMFSPIGKRTINS